MNLRLDEDHAEAEAQSIIGAVCTAAEEVAVEESLNRSLDAWWRFLDGVQTDISA